MLLVNTDDPIREAVQANYFSDVHKLYCAVMRKMMKILLFDDRVINDLIVLDPTKRDELTYAPTVRLAERFDPFVDQKVTISRLLVYGRH